MELNITVEQEQKCRCEETLHVLIHAEQNRYMQSRTDTCRAELIHADQNRYMQTRTDTCRPELIHADQNRYMQTRIDTCRLEPQTGTVHADWNCRLELYKIQTGTIQAHQNHIKQTGTDSSVRVHGCRCGFVCGLGGSDHSNKLTVISYFFRLCKRVLCSVYTWTII